MIGSVQEHPPGIKYVRLLYCIQQQGISSWRRSNTNSLTPVRTIPRPKSVVSDWRSGPASIAINLSKPCRSMYQLIDIIPYEKHVGNWEPSASRFYRPEFAEGMMGHLQLIRLRMIQHRTAVPLYSSSTRCGLSSFEVSRHSSRFDMWWTAPVFPTECKSK